MGFGDRLAQKRKANGLTQGDLGKGLGTDGADAAKSVVYGWEKDQHYPRVDQLVLICEKLQCSADYLLFGHSGEWPFSVPVERFERLTEKQKGYVERALEDAIEKCEATEPAAPPPSTGLEGKYPRTDILPFQLRSEAKNKRRK